MTGFSDIVSAAEAALAIRLNSILVLDITVQSRRATNSRCAKSGNNSTGTSDWDIGVGGKSHVIGFRRHRDIYF